MTRMAESSAKPARVREIGLGIIGSGRIGTLRARLAAGHSAVASIAVSDLDPANAEKLAALVGGRSHGDDNLAVIDDPAVTAVIVSTSEGEHLAPMLAAIERGKPVLVEKPIALTVREADQVLAALQRSGGNLRVGYSRRYKERYQIARAGGEGPPRRSPAERRRVFNSHFAGAGDAQAQSARHAGGGCADLLCRPDELAFEGRKLVGIYARGQTGVLKDAGYDVPDVSYSVLTATTAR